MKRTSTLHRATVLFDDFDITRIPLSGKRIRIVRPLRPKRGSSILTLPLVSPDIGLSDYVRQDTPPSPKPAPTNTSPKAEDADKKHLFGSLPPTYEHGAQQPCESVHHQKQLSKIGAPFVLGILLASGLAVYLNFNAVLLVHPTDITQARTNFLISAFVSLLVGCVLLTTTALWRTCRRKKIVQWCFKNLWQAPSLLGPEQVAKEQRPESSDLTTVDPEHGHHRPQQTVGNVSIATKLCAAQWPITVNQFYCIQGVLALFVFILARFTLSLSGAIGALILAPILILEYLNFRYSRRLKNFEPDFFVFLLCFSQLLRTGMNPLTALSAAGKSLPESSEVKREIIKVLEAVKSGLSQASALTLFGEHLPHAQIVSFRKAMSLSHHTGGPLSEMLGQISQQVKAKTMLRTKAVSTVQEERLSMVIISLLMIGVFVMTFFYIPDVVSAGLSNPWGRELFEGGIVLILFSVLWALKLTDIKL